MTLTTTEADRARPQKPRVRDRILRTACELFYEEGINNVGVDAIVSAAGTNKMSFYRSFASKDELVAEYLKEFGRLHWAWWDRVTAPYPDDPRRQVEALFDAAIPRCRQERTWGCAAANAAVEIRDCAHPARSVIHRQKAETRRCFRALARAMNARDPVVLGDALTLLFEGAAMTKLTFACREGPYVNVAKTVRSVLDSQLG